MPSEKENLSVRGGGSNVFGKAWAWLKARPAVAIALGGFALVSIVGIVLSECGVI